MAGGLGQCVCQAMQAAQGRGFIGVYRVYVAAPRWGTRWPHHTTVSGRSGRDQFRIIVTGVDTEAKQEKEQTQNKYH